MGFNIGGLVINQNYDKDINLLGKDLQWDISIIEEISFEEASANWTPEEEFRLYFSEKATLIFFPLEWVAEQYHSASDDTLNYVYSEMTMAFHLDFFQKGNLVRSIFEHEGVRHVDVGQPLTEENENTGADSLILTLMDKLLDIPFGDIDLEGRAFRCN